MTPDTLYARASAIPLEDALRQLSGEMRGDIAVEQRARLMNLSGDLCFDARQHRRALLFFDAAIDLYLAAGRFAAGAEICEKLVRLKPDVVRARCTLAWLAIARGLDDEAARRVEDYVGAALRLERPTVAQRQLRAMAQEVDSETVLEAVARGLLKLGDRASADRIFNSIHQPDSRARRVWADPEERERAIILRLTQAWSG